MPKDVFPIGMFKIKQFQSAIFFQRAQQIKQVTVDLKNDQLISLK